MFPKNIDSNKHNINSIGRESAGAFMTLSHPPPTLTQESSLTPFLTDTTNPERPVLNISNTNTNNIGKITAADPVSNLNEDIKSKNMININTSNAKRLPSLSQSFSSIGAGINVSSSYSISTVTTPTGMVTIANTPSAAAAAAATTSALPSNGFNVNNNFSFQPLAGSSQKRDSIFIEPRDSSMPPPTATSLNPNDPITPANNDLDYFHQAASTTNHQMITKNDSVVNNSNVISNNSSINVVSITDPNIIPPPNGLVLGNKNISQYNMKPPAMLPVTSNNIKTSNINTIAPTSNTENNTITNANITPTTTTTTTSNATAAITNTTINNNNNNNMYSSGILSRLPSAVSNFEFDPFINNSRRGSIKYNNGPEDFNDFIFSRSRNSSIRTSMDIPILPLPNSTTHPSNIINNPTINTQGNNNNNNNSIHPAGNATMNNFNHQTTLSSQILPVNSPATQLSNIHPYLHQQTAPLYPSGLSRVSSVMDLSNTWENDSNKDLAQSFSTGTATASNNNNNTTISTTDPKLNPELSLSDGMKRRKQVNNSRSRGKGNGPDEIIKNSGANNNNNNNNNNNTTKKVRKSKGSGQRSLSGKNDNRINSNSLVQEDSVKIHSSPLQLSKPLSGEEEEEEEDKDPRQLLGSTKIDQLMLILEARKKGITEKITTTEDGELILNEHSGVIPDRATLVGGVEKPIGANGVKQHECSVCKKKFIQATHLEVHMRSHRGEKPFECSWCGKRFTQGGNLRTHQRLHTGEKPYECDICHKKFARKGNLDAHKVIHRDVKPYVCKLDNCFKSFTQLGNMKSHQNRFHSETVMYLTKRMADLDSTQTISEEERTLLDYFASVYKNSNKGIKGRGKSKYKGNSHTANTIVTTEKKDIDNGGTSINGNNIISQGSVQFKMVDYDK